MIVTGVGLLAFNIRTWSEFRSQGQRRFYSRIRRGFGSQARSRSSSWIQIDTNSPSVPSLIHLVSIHWQSNGIIFTVTAYEEVPSDTRCENGVTLLTSGTIKYANSFEDLKDCVRGSP